MSGRSKWRATMDCYVGFDASLRKTSICVVDSGGRVLCEGVADSQPDAIAKFLKSRARGAVRIGTMPGMRRRCSRCRSTRATATTPPASRDTDYWKTEHPQLCGEPDGGRPSLDARLRTSPPNSSTTRPGRPVGAGELQVRGTPLTADVNAPRCCGDDVQERAFYDVLRLGGGH